MTYRTLYTYFPLFATFSQRELPRDVAITVGVRVMQLRQLFSVIEEKRLALVETHAQRNPNDDSKITDEDGRVKMISQHSFQVAWGELLEGEVVDMPSFSTQLTAKQLPDDLTGIEIEAMLQLDLFTQDAAQG